MVTSVRIGWLLLLALGCSVGAIDAQQLTYVSSKGCGNIVLYGWTGDHTEAIIVRADRDKLGLHGASRAGRCWAAGFEIACGSTPTRPRPRIRTSRASD